jgi:hypothetical protein
VRIVPRITKSIPHLIGKLVRFFEECYLVRILVGNNNSWVYSLISNPIHDMYSFYP